MPTCREQETVEDSALNGTPACQGSEIIEEEGAKRWQQPEVADVFSKASSDGHDKVIHTNPRGWDGMYKTYTRSSQPKFHNELGRGS